MSRDALPPRDPAAWQAQSLRLIAFPTVPQHDVQQNWWQELTGAERETCTQKKREREEEGAFEGTSLSLSIDLLRVQWAAAPRVPVENLPEGLPNLGTFAERKDWFRNLMHGWLAVSPPIRRLAFSGVLLHPVASKEAGYEMLNRYLRCVDIDPESTDFLYRINRPVRSRTDVANLCINRLTTWSVGKFAMFVREQLLGLASQDAGQQVARSEVYACVVELDINTVPEPADRVLPQEALPRIFDELVEHGLDIATKGDARP